MTRPTILLVNGNSREDLTNRMAALARAKLGNMADIEPMTIALAPQFVSNRTEAVKAATAILDAVNARFTHPNSPQPDAVMLACFGEPGLWALRDSIQVPVTGMVEASVAAAMQLGRRIAILTSGRDWPPQIEDLLRIYGQSSRVVRVTALPDSALSEDHAIWHPALIEAVAHDAALGGAEVLILGGGPLTGRAEKLTPSPEILLVDAFDATLWQTLALAQMAKPTGSCP